MPVFNRNAHSTPEFASTLWEGKDKVQTKYKVFQTSATDTKKAVEIIFQPLLSFVARRGLEPRTS